MTIVNKINYGIEHFHNSTQIIVEKKKSKLRRTAHLKKALEYVTIEGSILEFGVFQGNTITVIANKFTNNTIHGFDSFEGLPEDWDIGHKIIPGDTFNRDGILPTVPKNVKFWVGWFEDSLPKYLNEHNEPIKLLHIDCDLYSSTVTVLDALNPFIVKDTIIILDDFYPWGHIGYANWEAGEYKALHDWIKKYDRSFEVLLHNNHQQTSIKIVS